MKRILLTLITIIFISSSATFAQKSSLVTGRVLDKLQNLSLPGATLKLGPTNKYTISDQYGKFAFLNVPAGEYTLEVTYLGYQSFMQRITVEEGKTFDINPQLLEGAIIGKEVVVLGDRLRGQAKALNQQKNNSNISNIVSADQVGRFPDANIGDAMKRIPGITMQNDQGEARDVIIRGLAPELNSVTLNGDRIPSAEGNNRRVQMDLIPSDMIQTIEVNKTLTPDMDADAIGGSVNLVTRAAPNGERISVTLSGGLNPIRDKALYSGSFIYGNRFADKKLGVVFSTSYNNNQYGSDNVEAVWVKDKFNNVYLDEHDIRKYDVQRIRRSFSLSTDYKFNAKNTITLNGMYNWRDDYENRFRVRYTKVKPVYDANNNIINFKGKARRQTKGGSDDYKDARLERQQVKIFSLKGEHLLSSKLDLDWSASYSDASEKRPNERYNEYESGTVDLTQDISDPSFPQLFSPNLATNKYNLRTLSEQNGFTKESEVGLKANFRVPLTLVKEQKGRLRFGLRLRLKNKERDNNFFDYTPKTAFGNLSTQPTVNFNGNNYQVGSQFAPGTFVTKDFLGNLNLSDTNLFTPKSDPAEFLATNYNAKENIYATYLRYDQNLSNKLSFITGARLEYTDLNYTGNSVKDDSQLLGSRNSKNNYLNILPSITFKYDATRDLVLRAAYSTSIARPNYYDLVPYFNSLPGDDALSVGNSDLKAAFANNVDFMAENYFKSVGLISGGFFYKNINNFIYTFRDGQYTTDKFTRDYPNETNPIPAGVNWNYTQRRNGDAVNLYGFEVAFQRQLDFLPGALKGLGIYTNYTYTKSNAKGVFNADGNLRTDVSLPGTAPHLFNASLSFETKKLVARVSFNYAAAYVDELGGDTFEDRFYDKQSFLDANASYKIAKKVRVFGEANNLTNQPLRYYQGIESRTAQVEYYRPRYNFGLKFDL